MHWQHNLDITTLGMKKHHGFTLIELIAVAMIAVILAAVAVPNFTSFVQDTRISSMTNEMITDLYYARSEAIKRNRRVTMCRSASPDNANATCDATSANNWNNGDWSNGWIIFVDSQDAAGTSGADGIRQAAEILLKPLVSRVGHDIRSTPGRHTLDNYISYTPRGLARTVGGDSQNGIMRVCDERGTNSARAITVTVTGRAEASAPPASSAAIGSC